MKTRTQSVRRRLRETGGADPWCGPGLTTSAVSLSMFEYYAYSISPGQAAAHGGHAMLSGGHVVLLKNHVHTHKTSLEYQILHSGEQTYQVSYPPKRAPAPHNAPKLDYHEGCLDLRSLLSLCRTEKSDARESRCQPYGLGPHSRR